MLKEEGKLLDNVGKVVRVLELLSDKEFKDRQDVNEILSLKYHILHYILKVGMLSFSCLNILVPIFLCRIPVVGIVAAYLLHTGN